MIKRVSVGRRKYSQVATAEPSFTFYELSNICFNEAAINCRTEKKTEPSKNETSTL